MICVVNSYLMQSIVELDGNQHINWIASGVDDKEELPLLRGGNMRQRVDAPFMECSVARDSS